MLNLTKNSAHLVKSMFIRNISCSTTLSLDQRWREEQGLPANPNEFGELTSMPDYTFLDGRPTPLGSNQHRRLVNQRAVASKIVVMNRELDMAKRRYQELQERKKKEKLEIMQAKLKPKGKYMLETKE